MPDEPVRPDEDLVLDPLRRIVTPERYAELEAAIARFTLDGAGADPDDDLAELGFLDLLTAEEEDVVVDSMVSETVGELRKGPTDPALLDAMITLLENGFRCRVRTQATVVTLISDTPLDIPVESGDTATGGLITVGVAVADSTRGTITTPYESEAQRAMLSTPGNRIAVRVSIRDPRRIALDFDAFTAAD